MPGSERRRQSNDTTQNNDGEDDLTRIKTYPALIGAVLATLLAVITPAHTDATLDKIKQRGKVIVGVSVSGAPFGSIDPITRQNVGYHVDLADSVGRHLGIPAETVAVTAGNRVQFLQQGRVDLFIANMQYTDERNEILSFVPTPYDIIGGAGLVSKNGGIKDWPDTRGKPACVSQGSNFTKPLIEDHGAVVKGLKDIPESVLALRGGSCVVSVHVGPTINQLLKDPDWKDYTVLPTELIPSPSVIWVRRGETDIQVLLDTVVQDWHKSGELIAIAERIDVPTKAITRLREKYLGQ